MCRCDLKKKEITFSSAFFKTLKPYLNVYSLIFLFLYLKFESKIPSTIQSQARNLINKLPSLKKFTIGTAKEFVTIH